MNGLDRYLDELGLGSGKATLTPIGEGHSNLTYLLQRDAVQLVLRRPPHGPLSASANDVIREARILKALAGTAVAVPEVIATCEDIEVIGAPFFLMKRIDGIV